MNFQQIVLLIAIILLCTFLTLIGYTLYSKKFKVKFPPVVSDCPDYWVATTDASNKSVCTNPNHLGKDTSSCRHSKDFNSAEYKGDKGDCRKAKWANSCDLSWSGITNNPTVCKAKKN